MRAMLFTLMSMTIVASIAMAATVYKWVDEDGVVHYSDQPHENAQKVELKAPQTYSAPKNTPAPPAPRIPMPKKAGPVYQSCTISQPTNDQIFMNTSTVPASVTVNPVMRAGDQAVVTMDGQKVPGVPLAGGSFTISPVDRGTHSLQFSVMDAQGRSVCQSGTVTFHVHTPALGTPGQSAPTAPTAPGVIRPRG